MHMNETIVKKFAKDILDAFNVQELVRELQNKNERIGFMNVDVIFDLKGIEIYTINTQKIRAEKNYYVLNFDVYIMDKKVGLVKKDELLYKLDLVQEKLHYITDDFISHMFSHYSKYNVFKLKDTSLLKFIEADLKDHFVYELTPYGTKETLPTTKETLYKKSHIYIGKYGKLFYAYLLAEFKQLNVYKELQIDIQDMN